MEERKENTIPLAADTPEGFPNGFKRYGSLYYKLGDKDKPLEVRNYFGKEITDIKSIYPIINLILSQGEKIEEYVDDFGVERTKDLAFDLLYFVAELSELFEDREAKDLGGCKVEIVRPMRFDNVAGYLVNLHTIAKEAASELIHYEDCVKNLKRLLESNRIPDIDDENKGA